MKIADIRTYVVENPPPHFGGLYWIFLKLTTDSGVSGFEVSYYAQRVICQNMKSDDELLGLIACYFPSLVNEEYQASF